METCQTEQLICFSWWTHVWTKPNSSQYFSSLCCKALYSTAGQSTGCGWQCVPDKPYSTPQTHNPWQAMKKILFKEFQEMHKTDCKNKQEVEACWSTPTQSHSLSVCTELCVCLGVGLKYWSDVFGAGTGLWSIFRGEKSQIIFTCITVRVLCTWYI